MIAVDSSVWIRAFRSAASQEALILRSLLDDDMVVLPVPVRSELLMGTRKLDRPRVAAALKSVPLLYPTDESWKTLDEWTVRATASGWTFSMNDLLIGVLAADHGALLWSVDSDFDRMEELKLVGRYR